MSDQKISKKTNHPERVWQDPSSRMLEALTNPNTGLSYAIGWLTDVQITTNSQEIIFSGQNATIAYEVFLSLETRIENSEEITHQMVMEVLMNFQPAPRNQPEVMLEEGREDHVFKTPKRVITAITKGQVSFVANLTTNTLNFGCGPAGSGKTYLAVAAAAASLVKQDVDRIVLTRPAVEAGERLGFLPGDMKDKVDPYMQPLYDALNDFFPSKQLGKLIEEKAIEIAPLAFMRGRTLKNAFIVLDEAQNTTEMQMKMFLTRLGEGSKMAVVGDLTQSDLPKNTISGLASATQKLSKVDEIGLTQLSAADCVRHPLVAKILEAYDEEPKS